MKGLLTIFTATIMIGIHAIDVTAKAEPGARNTVAALKQLGARLTFSDRGEVTGINFALTKARARITDPELARLHLDRLPHVEIMVFAYAPITNAGLVHLHGNHKLRELRLISTKVSDDGIADLWRLRSLELLYLGGRAITDAGLVHLEKSPHLSALHLAHMDVTDAGLVHLQGIAHLRELSLRDSNVTDTGLAAFRELPAQLASLVRLQDLSLAATRVTDTGLAHLQALERLESLDFSNNGSRITNRGTKGKGTANER